MVFPNFLLSSFFLIADSTRLLFSSFSLHNFANGKRDRNVSSAANTLTFDLWNCYPEYPIFIIFVHWYPFWFCNGIHFTGFFVHFFSAFMLKTVVLYFHPHKMRWTEFSPLRVFVGAFFFRPLWRLANFYMRKRLLMMPPAAKMYELQITETFSLIVACTKKWELSLRQFSMYIFGIRVNYGNSLDHLWFMINVLYFFSFVWWKKFEL